MKTPLLYTPIGIKRTALMIGTMAVFAILATPHLALASGSGLGQLMTTDTQSQVNPIMAFMIDIFFVAGLALMGVALFKIVEVYSDGGGGRTTIKTPIVLFLVGGALMAIVAVSGVGVGTIFSGGSAATQGPQVGSLSVN